MQIYKNVRKRVCCTGLKVMVFQKLYRCFYNEVYLDKFIAK